MYLIFIKSLPINLINRLRGVIIIKNMNIITNGAIILPSSSPNFIQILLNGVKTFEFNKPKIKKTIERLNGNNFI